MSLILLVFINFINLSINIRTYIYSEIVLHKCKILKRKLKFIGCLVYTRHDVYSFYLKILKCHKNIMEEIKAKGDGPHKRLTITQLNKVIH